MVDRVKLALVVLWCSVTLCIGETGRPVLAQKPAINGQYIVFSYAGDLWRVPRQGGDAVRLTIGSGVETDPIFSPDGNTIAFRGEYDGNFDVYVVSVAGGSPRRLTYHPGFDVPVSWTPDGKAVVFRSQRSSYSRFARLFTMPVDGGFPSEINLPMAEYGSFSPDQQFIAYMPLAPAFETWKGYRGGQTTAIWIARLADGQIQRIPRDNSNDFNPMWIGRRVYFLSDRNGPVTLFCYDTDTKKVDRVLPGDGPDIRSANAASDAIVYEQFDSIHVFDLRTGTSRPVPIRVVGDFPAIRPSLVKLAGYVRKAALSPRGNLVLFEARGEILTVSAKTGDARNLTKTSGVAERDPSWSPDGRYIAYFSDESGEYQLHLAPQFAGGECRKLPLTNPPVFYSNPVWSPDSAKIAFTDSQLRLWFVNVSDGTSTLIDQDTYQTPVLELDPAWSPDSSWIAYAKLLKNHLRGVFLYSTAKQRSYQVSDGMSDARHAVFDKDGRNLYFTASTNVGPSTAWLDLSSMDRASSRNVYIAVLRNDDPSPLAPNRDEEATPRAAKAKQPGVESDKSPQMRIDLEDLCQRILPLPLPARDYAGILAGKTGTIFLVERAAPGVAQGIVHRFDLRARKADKILDGVLAFDVSGDGEKILYRQGQSWYVSDATGAVKPGEGAINVDAMEALVDPKSEWRQMFSEVWRLERDYFYDPGLHGLDWQAIRRKYEPYLESVVSREDLNSLFSEMLRELSVGHIFVGGGASPEVKRIPGGLLGADFKTESGRYRITHVYSAESWNPEVRAPLAELGVKVSPGEFLIAVNGAGLRLPENIYQRFEGTAGKAVSITVGPNADGSGSRDLTVIPIESELRLRNLSWIERNRRLVERLSDGRLAYVYLSNTKLEGLRSFNRYYFSQIGKEGLIIDERFNSGGQMADYIVSYLARPVTNYFLSRAGEPFTSPQNVISGPKAILINEYAGSGGDTLAWLFRYHRLGPLIGKRTLGAVVGFSEGPQLIDGGFVTAPNFAFFNMDGQWELENRGVSPDMEVELDPAAVRSGHDSQLEAAVQALLSNLAREPIRQPKLPSFIKLDRQTGLSAVPKN